MGDVEILKRIVKEDGSCSWAGPDECVQCPLSRLKMGSNGQWTNCIEAIGVDGLSEEEADKKYKEAALRKLLDMQLEETLEGKVDGS